WLSGQEKWAERRVSARAFRAGPGPAVTAATIGHRFSPRSWPEAAFGEEVSMAPATAWPPTRPATRRRPPTWPRQATTAWAWTPSWPSTTAWDGRIPSAKARQFGIFCRRVPARRQLYRPAGTSYLALPVLAVRWLARVEKWRSVHPLWYNPLMKPSEIS